MAKPKDKQKLPAIPVPVLDDETLFDDYKVEVNRWDFVTNYHKTKKATILCMHLKGKAKRATLDIEQSNLRKPDGVKFLLNYLESVFHPDADSKRFQIYQRMRDLNRSPGKSVYDFILEYEALYQKFKKEKMEVDHTTAAFDLLESCNLEKQHRDLVRATLPNDISYDSMKATLLKIFGTEGLKEKTDEQVFYGAPSTSASSYESSQPTLQSSSRPYNRMIQKYIPRSRYGKRKREHSSERYQNSSASRWNSDRSYNSGGSRWNSEKYRRLENSKDKETVRVNSLGKDGKPTTCTICKAITHWMRNCPEKDKILVRPTEEQKWNDEKSNFTMFLGCTNTDNKESTTNLVKEAKDHAILDSGCITTVCGEAWLRDYITSLPKSLSSQIKVKPSNQSFTFGDGRKILSSRSINLPCWVGGIRGSVTTDVVDCNIPLLLSTDSMTAINLVLTFKGLEATVLQNNIPVKIKRTSSGHLALPIGL